MDRLEPALLLVAFLALAILGFAFLELGHLNTEAKYDVALKRDDAILAEVRADEVRLCVAAKSTGDQTIIKILCPPPGGKP